MILLDNVSKYYPGYKTPALEEINLHIQPKEFVFLVGASGAGKSTLIKMLTREEKPSYGNIIVGGIDYRYLKKKHIPHLRRRIGVVFQDFKLLPNRTVHENVAFALEIVGVSGAEIKRTVPKVLELVGLSEKAHEFPGNLSGGERQRVAIARSMARQPKILIADEPTGNLDPENSDGIIRLLEEINNFGTTILVTTHDAEVVNKLKKRVVTLSHGRIIGDQKQGGYYDLDGSRTRIAKRSLGGPAPTAPRPQVIQTPTPVAPQPQPQPAPQPQPTAQPQSQPFRQKPAPAVPAPTQSRVMAPRATKTATRPATKSSGSAVLEQMRRAKASDSAKPKNVAKRRSLYPDAK